MPVKRRTSKRRQAERPEAWDMLFKTGFDYLGDLGIPEDEARSQAGEAWERFGRAFMGRWQPDRSRSQPWALEQFGEP